MNETGKEQAEPRFQHQQRQHRRRWLPLTKIAETTIGETEEEIRNVEKKVEQEDQSKNTSGEKLQS